MKKRVLSLLMALAMCLSMLPVTALAEEPQQQTEQEQTVPAPEETPGGEEQQEQPAPEELETPPAPEKESDEAVEAVQVLIDALPTEVTAENVAEIERQLMALDAALEALTEEQYALLDMTRYNVLCAALANLTKEQDEQANGHSHPICGKTCGHTGSEKHTDVTWTGVSSLNEITTAGNYYLTQNVELTSAWQPATNVVLDLCGHSITANNAFDAITVGEGVHFTLTDCKGDNENYGSITHAMKDRINRYNGRGVNVSANGSFTMYGGCIGANLLSSDEAGAGVRVADGATFTMLGGEIAGNTVSAKVNNNGGGIWTAGTTTIGGDAEITRNRALAGGGVYVDGGTLTLQDSAKVTGNISTNKYNSGIFVGTAGELCVSGSVQVTENKDSGIVGNVYLAPDSNQRVKPITVKGELKGASIKVTFLNDTLNAIGDSNPMTIAKAEAGTEEAGTEGWIKSDSFVLEGNTAHTLYVTDNGKTAMLGTHVHEWVYEPKVISGNESITAKCSNSDCKVDGGSVTIKAPTGDLTYNGSGKPATLEGNFNTGAADPTITYTLLKDKKYIALPDGETVPTNAGQYKASITVGNATASVDYTIKQATLTAEDFTFTPPENLVYDGNEKVATVTCKKSGAGAITVLYKDSQGGFVDAISVGTYTVKIWVGQSTNYETINDSITGDNWTFTVTAATQWTVNIPDSWNTPTEVIEGSTIRTELNKIGGYGSINATGVNNETLYGDFAWYTDADCTELVDNNAQFAGKAGTTVKLYWKFTLTYDYQKKNYTTDTMTGSVDFKIVEGDKQGLVLKGAGGVPVTAGTKNYGNWPFTLKVENSTDPLNEVPITYASSNPNVATITVDTDGKRITVTICGVGTTTITATAARVDGQYAKTTATYTLTVEKGEWSEAVTVSMQDYSYNGNVKIPSLSNYSSGDPNVVTYYYNTTGSNSGGTKWENIEPTTLDAGDYFMYAEIAGTANYKAYTTKASPFTVYKAYPTCAAPTGLTATYGQKLGDITLTNPAGNTPGTWRWENDTQSVGDASTTAKKFTAIFTPTDTVNYEVMEKSVNVTVNPAGGGSLAPVDRTLKYGDTGEYTYTPDWSGLPTGQTWNYASSYALSADSTASVTHSIDNATGKLTYAISGAKAGDVVTITLKAQCNNYEDYTITLKITVKQATPAGEPGYTKITSRGRTLADVGLTIGTLQPDKGEFEWIDEEGNSLPNDTAVEANKSYTWRFTPADNNYAPLTGTITPWVSSGIVIVPSYPTESGNVSNPSTGAAGQGSIACGVAVLAAGICLLGTKKKNQE